MEKLRLDEAPNVGFHKYIQRKMAFRNSQINVYKDNFIDYEKSTHTKEIQRSRFLTIDNDIQSLTKNYELEAQNVKAEQHHQLTVTGFGDAKPNKELLALRKQTEQDQKLNNLVLKYCNHRAVNQQRH